MPGSAHPGMPALPVEKTPQLECHLGVIRGFDPEFAGLSPGRMIDHHAICDAAEADAVEFDFLRGEEAC